MKGSHPLIRKSHERFLLNKKEIFTVVNYKFFCFFLGGGAPVAYSTPRLGVELELQLLAYTTAHGWILNPLREARDRTCVLMDTSWFH